MSCSRRGTRIDRHAGHGAESSTGCQVLLGNREGCGPEGGGAAPVPRGVVLVWRELPVIWRAVTPAPSSHSCSAAGPGLCVGWSLGALCHDRDRSRARGPFVLLMPGSPSCACVPRLSCRATSTACSFRQSRWLLAGRTVLESVLWPPRSPPTVRYREAVAHAEVPAALRLSMPGTSFSACGIVRRPDREPRCRPPLSI